MTISSKFGTCSVRMEDSGPACHTIERWRSHRWASMDRFGSDLGINDDLEFSTGLLVPFQSALMIISSQCFFFLLFIHYLWLILSPVSKEKIITSYRVMLLL